MSLPMRMQVLAMMCWQLRLPAAHLGSSFISPHASRTASLQIAGEIKDFDPGELVDKKSARRLDLVIKYILVAGKKVSSHAATTGNSCTAAHSLSSAMDNSCAAMRPHLVGVGMLLPRRAHMTICIFGCSCQNVGLWQASDVITAATGAA